MKYDLKAVLVKSGLGIMAPEFKLDMVPQHLHTADAEEVPMLTIQCGTIFDCMTGKSTNKTITIDLQIMILDDEKWLNEQLQQRLAKRPDLKDYYGTKFILKELHIGINGKIEALYWLPEGNHHRQARTVPHSISKSAHNLDNGEPIFFASYDIPQIYW